MTRLFSCTYRQQMFVQASDGSEERRTPVESVFVHPIIGVEEEGKDLYDCLGELYLSGSEIEYEGKKGYIVDHMERFPPLLYIQMRVCLSVCFSSRSKGQWIKACKADTQRSQFDMATGRERKTNTHIPFGQSLVMDRYLSTVDPEKREKSMHLTREMTRLRTRLHELRDKKVRCSDIRLLSEAYILMNSRCRCTKHSLTSTKPSPNSKTSPTLVEEIKGMEQQLQRCKADLEELWAGQREYEYELVSVFMHRGKTSGAGHYWTYQAYLPEHCEYCPKVNSARVEAGKC